MRVLVVSPGKGVASLLMVLTLVRPLEAAGPRVDFIHSFTIQPAAGWRLYLGNFAGDSYPEIAAFNSNNGTISIGKWTGSIFSFSLYATVTSPKGWVFVPGQFYGDSLTDLAGYHKSDGSLWVGQNRESRFKFIQYGTITPHPGLGFAKGRFNYDSLDDLAFYYPSDGSLWMAPNRVSDFKKVLLAGFITPPGGWTLIAGNRFRADTNTLDDILLYRRESGGLVVGEPSGSSFFLTSYGHLYSGLNSSSIAVTRNRPLVDLFTFTEFYFPFRFHANASDGSGFNYTISVEPKVSATEKHLTGGYLNYLLVYEPATGRVQFGRLIVPPWVWN